MSEDELCAHADVVLTIDGADDGTCRRLHPGQVLIGLLRPLAHPSLVRTWLDCGITTISLDLLPPTPATARSMDALGSQAAVAGYKAAVLAADTFGGFFARPAVAPEGIAPARVLVIGSGPAAAAAIDTAGRLGAAVTSHDIGGPDQVAEFDVVITTVPWPGHRPPTLVTATEVRRMRSGSVIVDLATGPLGGNVEGAEMDMTVVLGHGVIVIGAGNLPAQLAPAASTLYAGNIVALLSHLAPGGVVTVDPTDDIQAAIVVTHAGRVVSTEVAASQHRATITSGGVG